MRTCLAIIFVENTSPRVFTIKNSLILPDLLFFRDIRPDRKNNLIQIKIIYSYTCLFIIFFYRLLARRLIFNERRVMFNKDLLWDLRTNLPMEFVLKNLKSILEIPYKMSEGFLRFLCPNCHEMNATVNPKNNMAHCFCCKKNFNNIDLLIVKGVSFKTSVMILCGLWDTFQQKMPSPAATEPRRYSTQPTKLGEILR